MKACFAFCFISSQALSLITFPVSLRINSAICRSLRFTNKLCFQSLCAKLPVFKHSLVPSFLSVGFSHQFLFVLLARGAGKLWHAFLWYRFCQIPAWWVMNAVGMYATSRSTSPLFDLEFNSFVSDTAWKQPCWTLNNPGVYIYPFLLLFSRSVLSYSLRLHGLQHARLPCPSPSSPSLSFSIHILMVN